MLDALAPLILILEADSEVSYDEVIDATMAAVALANWQCQC